MFDDNNKKKLEFSKFLVFITGIIFLAVLIVNTILVIHNYDTSIATQEIITTGGIFGSTIIFYLNKAKLENAIKIKVEFFKFKEKYRKEHNIPYNNPNEMEDELSIIDDSINDKINNTIRDSLEDETMNF